MKIIVDAMGGDNAPQAIVQGALEATPCFFIFSKLFLKIITLLISMNFLLSYSNINTYFLIILFLHLY